MSLNKEQRKHMASIRKLIKSRDWSDVRQGIALLKKPFSMKDLATRVRQVIDEAN